MAAKKETAAQKKARQQRAAQRKAASQSMRDRTAKTGTKAKVQKGTKPGTPVAKQKVKGGQPSSTVKRNTRGTKPAPKGSAGQNPAKGSTARASASRAKMVNLNKPTMQKLVRKAAQARKAASGRPLVKPAEAKRLMSQRAPKIREGAAKLRTIGDNGQVRAAQAKGAKLKAEAQARRGARKASESMAKKLGMAKLARQVAGIGRMGSIAGAAWEGLQSRNTADGTLDAAKKRGDYKPNQRRQPTPSEAKMYAAQEQKARAANAKREASKAAGSAKAFDDAFRSARKAGVKTFTWRGKKYTTEMK